MGTPSRLAVVLGTAKVQAKNLAVNEWMELIDKILSEIKPLLKYLDYYQPLANATHSWKGNFNDRIVPANVVLWPGEAYRINSATKVLRLAKFEEKSEPKVKKPNKEWKHNLTEVTFYLCREGRYIGTKFEFECTVARRLGDLTNRREEAKSGHIFLASPEHMKSYISQAQDIGYQVISNLAAAVNRTIEQREKRLQSLRGIGDFLGGITNRLNRH